MDLLRVVAMFMVCVLHINLCSGSLEIPLAAELNVRNGALVTEVVCLVAVPLYAMLTGYVCVNGTWYLSRYLRLWMQVAFYTVGFFLFRELVYQFGLMDAPDVGSEALLSAFLPIPFASPYWYFNAYTVVFLLIPFVNPLLKGCSREKLGALVLLLLGLVGVASVFSGGCSSAKLLVLYIVGASIKLYPPATPRRWLLWGMLLGWMITYAYCSVCEWKYAAFTFPSNLLSALCLFILFTRMEIRNAFCIKLIAVLAPLSFGVYLIHLHPCIWKVLFFGCTRLFTTYHYDWWLFPLCPVVLYLICSMVDACRAWLFKRCRVNALAEAMARQLGRMWNAALTCFQKMLGAGAGDEPERRA